MQILRVYARAEQSVRMATLVLGVVTATLIGVHAQPCTTLSAGVFDTVPVAPVSAASGAIFFATTAGDDTSKRTTIVGMNASTGASVIATLTDLDRTPKVLICDYGCNTLYLMVDTWQPATLCEAANAGLAALLRLDARAGLATPPSVDHREYLLTALGVTFSSYNRPGRVNTPATPGSYTYAFLPRDQVPFLSPPAVDIVRLGPAGSGLPAVTILASKALTLTRNMLMVVALAPELLALCVIVDFTQQGTTRFFAEAWDVAGLVASSDAASTVSIGSMQLDGSIQGASFVTADASASGTAALAFEYTGGATRIVVVRGQRFSSSFASMTIISQFALADTGPVPRLRASSLALAFSSEGLRVVAASTLASCVSSCTPYVVTALLTTNATGLLYLSTQGIVATYPSALDGAIAQPLLGNSALGGTGPDNSAAIVTFVDGSFAVPQVDVYQLPAASPLTGIRTASVVPWPPAMSSPASIAFQYTSSSAGLAPSPEFAYVALASGLLAKIDTQPTVAVVKSAPLPLARRFNDSDLTAGVQILTIPGLIVAIAWQAPSTAVVQTYSDADLTPVQQLSLTGVAWPPSEPVYDAVNNVIFWSDQLPSAASASPGFCIVFRTYGLTVSGVSLAATLSQISTISMTRREMCFPSTVVNPAVVQRVPLALSSDGSGQALVLHAATNGTFSALGVQIASGTGAGSSPAALASGPGIGVPYVRGLVAWPLGQAFFVVGSANSGATNLLVRRINTVTWSSTLLTAPSSTILATASTVFDGGFFFTGTPSGPGLLLSFDGGYTTVAVNQSADSSATLLIGDATRAVSSLGTNTVTALAPPGPDDRTFSALVAPRFVSPAYIAQRSVAIDEVLLPSTSPSATPSVSPSTSGSPSVSRSVAASPSVSSSISRSTTRSPSVSRSVTKSASRSPSTSVTPSLTASLSVSPSVTPSASPSPSVTRSFGSSPSSTMTQTSSSTYTPSAPATSPPSTVSPSVLPSATSSETGSDTATASATATSSATPSEGYSPDATVSSTITASATGSAASATATGSSSSSATSLASAAPSQSESGAATLLATATATATPLLALSPIPGGGSGNGSASGAAGGGASDAPSMSPAAVPAADGSSVAIVAAGGGGGGALLLLVLLAAAYAFVLCRRNRAARRRIAARIRKQGMHSLARASVTERALLLLQQSDASPGAVSTATPLRPGAVPAALLSPSGLEDMLMMTVPSGFAGSSAAAAKGGRTGGRKAGRAKAGIAGSSECSPLLINSFRESPISAVQLREGATQAALDALLRTGVSGRDASSGSSPGSLAAAGSGSSVRGRMTFGQPAVQDAHDAAAAALGARLPIPSLRAALDASLQAMEAALREQRRLSGSGGSGGRGSASGTSVAAALEEAAEQAEAALSAAMGSAALDALIDEAGDACAAFCDVWGAAALEAEADLPDDAAAPLDAQMDCIFAVAGETSSSSQKAHPARAASSRSDSQAGAATRSGSKRSGQVASVWPKVAALRLSIERRVKSQDAARTAVAFARSAAAASAVARFSPGGRPAPTSVRSVLFAGSGGGGAADDADADGVAVVAVEEGGQDPGHHNAAALARSGGAGAALQMQRLRPTSKSGAVTSAAISIHTAKRTAGVSSAAKIGVSATAAPLASAAQGSPEEQLRAARARGVMRAIAITAVTAQALQVAQLLQDSVTGEDEAAAALLGVTAGALSTGDSSRGTGASVSAAGLRLGLPHSAVRSLVAATTPLPPPPSSSAGSSSRAAAEAARLGLALCSIAAGADAAAKQEFNALAAGSRFGCCGASSSGSGPLSSVQPGRPVGGRVKAVAAGGSSAGVAADQDGPVPLPLTVNPLARKRSGGPGSDSDSPQAALPPWAASLPVLRARVSAVIAAAGTSAVEQRGDGASSAAAPGDRDSGRRASFDMQSWAPAVPRSLIAAKLARQQGSAKVKAKAAGGMAAIASGSSGGNGASSSRNRKHQSRASAAGADGPSADDTGVQLTPLPRNSSSAATSAASAGKLRMAHAPVTVAGPSSGTLDLGLSSVTASSTSSSLSSLSSSLSRMPGAATAAESPASLSPPYSAAAYSSHSARTVVCMPSAADPAAAATATANPEGPQAETAGGAGHRDYPRVSHQGSARAPRMSGVKVMADIGPGMARRTVSSSGRSNPAMSASASFISL